MTIVIKNKYTLLYEDFSFKCCVGLNGFTKIKKEGDKKTPRGLFSIGASSNVKPFHLGRKYMGWCNDIKYKKYYNKLVNIRNKVKHEKLYRKDYKYDFLIPIKYNWHRPKIPNGSAIFIHLTKNYKPTAGCIGLSKKDFLILIKLINRKTKIKIF